MGDTTLLDPALLASFRTAMLPKPPTGQGIAYGAESTVPASARDSYASNTGQALDTAFQAATYTRESVSINLAAEFQRVAARFAGADEPASYQAEQLEFSFFAESRVEQLAVYQERAARIADRLAPAEQALFTQVSQEVEVRFDFSMSLSTAAIHGFANMSEGFGAWSEIFNELMAFTQSLLDEADEQFNAFFQDFGGFFDSEETEALRAQLEDMLNQFFLGASSGSLPASTGEGVAATAVQLEFSFSMTASASVSMEVQESDPIMLDLDGDGFELTHHATGASFDILGNGRNQRTAFVTGGDAFLALDRNGDGIINSGRELFGDQNGAANGYEELRKLDSNEDGVLDSHDAQFSALRLFRDDGDGKTEAGELLSLEDAGIVSLNLAYRNVNEQAAGGNRIAQRATYTRADGTRGQAADAVLNYTV